MAKQPMRRTQARELERIRQRAHRERNQGLKWQIPLALGGALILLVAAYLVFTTAGNSSNSSAGGSGPHFQADTEKLDLGDQPLGNSVHASFNIKNTGGGTLTLNPPKIAMVLEGC